MKYKKTVGILYICTGKYSVFWYDFYISMEKFFLPNCEKKYFVFTDSASVDFEKESKNIYRFYQEDLGWPNNTLKRFHMFLEKESIISQTDYLFFFNANLVVKENIQEEEFLPSGDKKLIAVQHPSYFSKNSLEFPYERNAHSSAYIPYNKGVVYVQGALEGGITKYFISAIKTMKKNTDDDINKKLVAKWHDESHWNKYILDRSDVKILTPSYIYPEDSNIPFPVKLLSRDKKKYGGHYFLRKQKEPLVLKLKSIFKKIFIL